MTAAEELVLVDEALAAAYKAQSYSINGGGGGQSVVRADIDKLIGRKKELAIALARQSSTGTCPVAKFRRTD